MITFCCLKVLLYANSYDHYNLILFSLAMELSTDFDCVLGSGHGTARVFFIFDIDDHYYQMNSLKHSSLDLFTGVNNCK